MADNSFGKNFRFTTFGESHGPAIGCIVDGMPPLISLDENDISLIWIAASRERHVLLHSVKKPIR